MTTANEAWSIEISPKDAPDTVRHEHELIELDVNGTEWQSRLVDTAVDVPGRSDPSYFTVLVRRKPRSVAKVSETLATISGSSTDVPAGQDPKVVSGQNPLGERQNGRTGESGHRDSGHRDSAAAAAVEAAAVAGVDAGVDVKSFGQLPTVRSMGSGGRRAQVIGFDTEFTYREDDPAKRVIDSYQFACTDALDDGVLVQVVVLPLAGDRIYLEDALYIVSLAGGLHVLSPSREPIDPRGVLVRDVRKLNPRGKFDYSATRDAAFKARIAVVLACHFGNADLTAFRRPPEQRNGGEKHYDILRRVTSASGGLVSLQPARFMRKSGKGSNSYRWLPFSVTVRDTMCQAAPGHKSLAALGDVCGVPKLDVGSSIENMTSMRRDDLTSFLEYGVNDAVIVVEYLAMLWGLNIVPPVTLSGAGASAVRDGIMRYMGDKVVKDFLINFRGLVRLTDPEPFLDHDQLSYYTTRELVPVDGDANQSHTAWKMAFHGGWNSCLSPGHHPYPTFDHDIQSAYPSAMASVIDVDYVGGCIEEVVKDRVLTLDDFPLGPITPLVAYVSWNFPDDVVAPCLPVVVGDCVLYPRTSDGAGAAQGDDVGGYDGFHGAWCAGPELYLALKLGATVRVQIGYRMRLRMQSDSTPSRSLRFALRQMVEDRATAKKIFGKGSLEEQTVKVATNSVYGKLAQDVSERNGWGAWAEEMESIGGSSVTSPYHASMTTSLVRALLLAMANTIPILSVTTDGFITPVEEIEHFDCFGIANVFRAARRALVGDPTVWEIKHYQDDLVNFSTRGNVSLLEHGVLAKAGLKVPEEVERGTVAERRWFRDTALSRRGKIPNPYTSFPTFRELSRSVNRLDFHPVDRTPEVSTMDFDLKRQPLRGTLRVDVIDGNEMAGFDTCAWDSVDDYKHARGIAGHMQLVRYGTTGVDRPTGCLRTGHDWETWFKRFESARGRRIRTADSALLTELVAAHKAGLVVVDRLAVRVSVAQKVGWLSSLGMGEFTRAQWDHMSKKVRRSTVLRDADMDAVRAFADELNRGDGYV